MAELFDAVARANTILIDLARDVWGYVSLGYFKQKTQGGRDRLIHHAAQGQPDRLRERRRQPGPGQRPAAPPERKAAHQPLAARPDRLSTVLRNMGVALGYAVLAYQSLLTGLNKLELNETRWPPTWTAPGKCWPNRSRP
jgi:adenylosuccinate lyase